MNQYLKLPLLALFFVVTQSSFSQANWPRVITTAKGVVITLYQPQPESLNQTILTTRTVVSVKKDKTTEPVFGVFWAESTLNTDLETRMAALEQIKVTQLKFPEGTKPEHLTALTAILEEEIPKWNLIVPLDEIVATLEQEKTGQSDEFSTKAPEINYASTLTTLVLIDGKPIVKNDETIKMEKVINTPFLIVKDPADQQFYLFAGKFWYTSKSLESGWEKAAKLPAATAKLNKEIEKKAQESKDALVDTLPAKPTAILVRTQAAELIQTEGDPDFASITGTSLLYVTNSPDNIFRSVDDQHFYVVLSGRWYKSKALTGPWDYVAADKLPGDFAKIPEGSAKDGVLANVAGTDAAREAVMESQIPQTAKVDRKTATCTVTYDGSPKFDPIEGTNLAVAANSSLTVLRSGNSYFAVDNGVWFVSANPSGPWEVSEKRPEEVDKIPPQNQAYSTKYVYIYDVSPQYIYMGYTPGYMGCYVYGPTVIYGTGYYYRPWYGSIYYPRPVTYGFGMSYNPYMGWSMGFTYNVGFFSVGIGFGGYHGGYWGPPMYRPPYHHPPHHGGYPGGPHGGNGGYYGPRNPGSSNSGGIGNNGNNRPDRSNNIYNQRNGVSSRDVARNPKSGSQTPGRNPGTTRPAGNTPGTNPATRPASRDLQAPAKNNPASNNKYSDRSGNVYQNDKSGNWQKRTNDSWQNTKPDNKQQLERSQQMRDRGNMRSSQSREARPSAPSRPSPGSNTGGGRSAGGGRRR